MAYKILYLEDLNPETKVAELSNYGYDVDAYKPSSLEETLLQELTQKLNSECQVQIAQKSNEEVSIIDDTFTENEFADIVEVNAGNDVEINGNKLTAMDFLEAVHELFVKE